MRRHGSASGRTWVFVTPRRLPVGDGGRLCAFVVGCHVFERRGKQRRRGIGRPIHGDTISSCVGRRMGVEVQDGQLCLHGDGRCMRVAGRRIRDNTTRERRLFTWWRMRASTLVRVDSHAIQYHRFPIHSVPAASHASDAPRVGILM